MPTFHGRLWLNGNIESALPAEVTVDNDRMTITSGDVHIGDWPCGAGGDVRSP